MAQKHKRRVTVDLKAEQVPDLARLEKELGMTAVAVLRRGLRLVKLMHENHKNGGTTLLLDAQGNGSLLEGLW